MFRCISHFHSPHGYSRFISGWLHVSEHGGLTLAGGQMPAQPLSRSSSAKQRGGNKMIKLTGRDQDWEITYQTKCSFAIWV